jgi:hypothetical protein
MPPPSLPNLIKLALQMRQPLEFPAIPRPRVECRRCRPDPLADAGDQADDDGLACGPGPGRGQPTGHAATGRATSCGEVSQGVSAKSRWSDQTADRPFKQRSEIPILGFGLSGSTWYANPRCTAAAMKAPLVM